MKKLILSIAVLALLCANVSAQSEKNVPANVKAAFTQKFSKATDVKWGKEGKTEWEAEFKMNGKMYSANFDMKANWKETEYGITVAEIPAAIKSSIEKNNAGCKIKSADISETPKGKIYEVTLLKDKKNMEVCFDESGKVIKE